MGAAGIAVRAIAPWVRSKSEDPAVVMPLLQGPRQLYYRNLLYTAVTRAKSCVTIVGSETVFQGMIHNTREQERKTSLAERIREIL